MLHRYIQVYTKVSYRKTFTVSDFITQIKLLIHVRHIHFSISDRIGMSVLLKKVQGVFSIRIMNFILCKSCTCQYNCREFVTNSDGIRIYLTRIKTWAFCPFELVGFFLTLDIYPIYTRVSYFILITLWVPGFHKI